MLAARIARLEDAAAAALAEPSRRASVAAVLSDPKVRVLADRVQAAYDAEPVEKRIGYWHGRVRVQQPAVYHAWLVVSQIIAERLGDPPLDWGLLLPEHRAAAEALRRDSSLGEAPPREVL